MNTKKRLSPLACKIIWRKKNSVLLYKADGTNMLNIPTDDKGLVIGKRGENIKRISQKYGKFFKII
jgi:transcription antitermination factor NusA-like protein